MKPSPPPGPPDVKDLAELVDQWATFCTSLERQDYTFDLDNWLNDVDVRELAAQLRQRLADGVFPLSW